MTAPHFPVWKGNGRPIINMRRTVDGIVWRFRTGAPWRDVPERFGNWNSIYGPFADWSRDGTGPVFLPPCRQLASVPTMSIGPCRWTRPSLVCISMAPPLPAPQGAPQNYKKLGDEEPGDRAIGRVQGRNDL